jgi:hypothetical protein
MKFIFQVKAVLTKMYSVQGSLQQEQDVALAIKKALTTDELAPKQKHVRSLILYSWELKSPGSLFIALKTFPIISDQVF